MSRTLTLTPNPCTIPGAAVKTPGGYRAFVLGADPDRPDRILIEYEAKSLGTDSYNPALLTLVCAAPDNIQPANAESIPSIDAELIPDLAELEAEIESGQRLIERGEQRIWGAAALIRQHRLWQSSYQSFEEYCLQRWGWQKSNAHEVAGAGEVLQQLRESGAPDENLPTSVAAIRPLKKLEATQRLQVLEVARAEAGKVTADTVKSAISKVILPPQTTPGYEYTPIEPRPCWFAPNGTDFVEAQAIAQNPAGNTRLLWGEGRESDIPNRSLRWEAPVDLQVFKPASDPETIEQGLKEGWIQPVSQPPLPNLAQELKALAQRKADEMFGAIYELAADIDTEDLKQIAAELHTAMVEILEFHFF